MPQISHIKYNWNFLDQLLLPYKYLWRWHVRNILFFFHFCQLWAVRHPLKRDLDFQTFCKAWSVNGNPDFSAMSEINNFFPRWSSGNKILSFEFFSWKSRNFQNWKITPLKRMCTYFLEQAIVLTCFDLKIANIERHIGRRITAALTLITDAEPLDTYNPVCRNIHRNGN